MCAASYSCYTFCSADDKKVNVEEKNVDFVSKGCRLCRRPQVGAMLPGVLCPGVLFLMGAAEVAMPMAGGLVSVWALFFGWVELFAACRVRACDD